MVQETFFNDGEEKIYSTQAVWSKLIKTRDGWRCANEKLFPERNHQLYDLNAHHILPKKHGGKNILSNGITYCRACHAAEHPEYQQKFTDVFKLEIIRIKDFFVSLIGLGRDLQYYRWLKFLTGKLEFRSLQKQIIKTIVEDKKHVFAVMPTGVGKSLLYQIPGLINSKNPSLIISPLKALQLDQVVQLSKKWIPATFINSSLDKSEVSGRIKGIVHKIFPFVFIHPKQLLFLDKVDQKFKIKLFKPLTSIRFDYLVVDEVHVVKNQGLSFVKEYYHLDQIYDLYNKPQLILLTATASKKTRDFIVEKLGIRKDEVKEFVGGFYRPEISLEMYRVNTFDQEQKKFIHKDEMLKNLLKNKPLGKTIVFATTVAQVDYVYDLLVEAGLNVGKYHSKLTSQEKEINFKSFTGNIPGKELDIMVATSAFGMGVNIPNIHQTIHYSLPFTLTDYYQQFGRAGRDGLPSVSQLLFDEKESTNIIDFINQKTLQSENEQESRVLMSELFDEERSSLLGYVNSDDKWQYILDYFGESKNLWGMPDSIKYMILLVITLLLIFLYFSFRYFQIAPNRL